MEDIQDILKEHILTSETAIMKHPVVKALRSGSLSEEQLRQFADVRFNHAAPGFEQLLEHTLDLAEAEGNKKDLVYELQQNLDDERGEGRSNGKGAHGKWREDFLEAIGVEKRESTDGQSYLTEEKDDVFTLVGMVLAAEYAIPHEFSAVLHAMREAFPDSFTRRRMHEEGTSEQIANTLYLQDHIEHDTQKHFPDLLRSIEMTLREPEDMQNLVAGIERFSEGRREMYDMLQQILGIDAIANDVQKGR